jgi:hypothetical protein
MKSGEIKAFLEGIIFQYLLNIQYWIIELQFVSLPLENFPEVHSQMFGKGFFFIDRAKILRSKLPLGYFAFLNSDLHYNG